MTHKTFVNSTSKRPKALPWDLISSRRPTGRRGERESHRVTASPRRIRERRSRRGDRERLGVVEERDGDGDSTETDAGWLPQREILWRGEPSRRARESRSPRVVEETERDSCISRRETATAIKPTQTRDDCLEEISPIESSRRGHGGREIIDGRRSRRGVTGEERDEPSRERKRNAKFWHTSNRIRMLYP